MYEQSNRVRGGQRRLDRNTNKKIVQGQATRQQIIDTAARLFAAHGYEATSIEAVLTETSVSRGALYHHFDGKKALFTAVVEAVEARITQQLVTASCGGSEGIAALRAGCNAWLGLAHDPIVRQVVLVDAPAVVGWQKWRDLEARYGFGLLKRSLNTASVDGGIPADLVEIFAHVLLAALIEVSLVIACAEDAAAATRTGRAAIGELIDRLLGMSADQPRAE